METQCFCKSPNYVRPAPIMMSLPKKHAKPISKSFSLAEPSQPTMTAKMLKSKAISSWSMQSAMPIPQTMPTYKTYADQQHSTGQSMLDNGWPFKITCSMLPMIYIDGLKYRSPSRYLMVIGSLTDGSTSNWLRVVNPYLDTTLGCLREYKEAVLDSHSVSYIVGDWWAIHQSFPSWRTSPAGGDNVL